MRSDRELWAGLGRGKRWALEAFYHRLRSARDDAAFWSTLTAMIPRGLPRDEHVQVDQLREHLDAPDLWQFVASAPVGLLVAFMLLSFVFAACNEPSTPDQHPAPSSANSDTGTVVPASTAVEPPILASGSAGPASSIDAGSQAADAGGQQPDAGTKDVQTMTPDELRTALRDYIARAQLPASERRRLARVLDEAPGSRVVASRSDLAKLFRENEPERIAVVLEQMALFQRVAATPLVPRPVTRYKGVDFA